MKPRTRRSADIALIEFLRPGVWWGHPYSIEMAFQALRWLIASAAGEKYVEHHQWHSTCAVGLMGGVGAVNGGCRPIKSLNDLLQRFHLAMLSRTDFRPEVARWRDDKGIHVGSVINMKFRHYKPDNPPAHLPWRSEDGIKKTLEHLLEQSSGKILTTQLNSVHADARVIHGVDLNVGADGFSFWLLYGCKDPAVCRMDSEWRHMLARTDGDEPFLDTLARAVAEFEKLIAQAEAVKA